MKITKEELLSIIKEEMNFILNEQEGSATTPLYLLSLVKGYGQETTKLVKTVNSMLTIIQKNSDNIKNQESQMREILDMIHMLKEMLKQK